MAVLDGRLHFGAKPRAVFVHMLTSDRYAFGSQKNSGFMTELLQPAKHWTPDVLLSPIDFISRCDFGFVHGLLVQADLGDDYATGFKYAQAIVERKPSMLLARLGNQEDPLLMWTEHRGFYE